MAATPGFRSAEEFVELMDRVFTMMSEDPEVGPRLRDADVPQRMEFPDLALVLNVRAAHVDEQGCLVWTWSDDIDWTPRVRLTMSSEVANRYFQGAENVPIAVARRRILAGGDLRRLGAHPDDQAGLRALPRASEGRLPPPHRLISPPAH